MLRRRAQMARLTRTVGMAERRSLTASRKYAQAMVTYTRGTLGLRRLGTGFPRS